jgi:hypothetical protein
MNEGKKEKTNERGVGGGGWGVCVGGGGGGGGAVCAAEVTWCAQVC